MPDPDMTIIGSDTVRLNVKLERTASNVLIIRILNAQGGEVFSTSVDSSWIQRFKDGVGARI